MSGVQLIEQRLGLFQIERVEAFGEPAVDRSLKVSGFIFWSVRPPPLGVALAYLLPPVPVEERFVCQWETCDGRATDIP
jgi:hypothetical protein